MVCELELAAVRPLSGSRLTTPDATTARKAKRHTTSVIPRAAKVYGPVDFSVGVKRVVTGHTGLQPEAASGGVLHVERRRRRAPGLELPRRLAPAHSGTHRGSSSEG